MPKIEWDQHHGGVTGTDGMGIIAKVFRGNTNDHHVSFVIYVPEDTEFSEVVSAAEAAAQTLRSHLGME